MPNSKTVGRKTRIFRPGTGPAPGTVGHLPAGRRRGPPAAGRSRAASGAAAGSARALRSPSAGGSPPLDRGRQSRLDRANARVARRLPAERQAPRGKARGARPAGPAGRRSSPPRTPASSSPSRGTTAGPMRPHRAPPHEPPPRADPAPPGTQHEPTGNTGPQTQAVSPAAVEPAGATRGPGGPATRTPRGTAGSASVTTTRNRTYARTSTIKRVPAAPARSTAAPRRTPGRTSPAPPARPAAGPTGAPPRPPRGRPRGTPTPADASASEQALPAAHPLAQRPSRSARAAPGGPTPGRAAPAPAAPPPASARRSRRSARSGGRS